jgi:hypothetical protein
VTPSELTGQLISLVNGEREYESVHTLEEVVAVWRRHDASTG